MGAKIDHKAKFFVEFLPERFQDAPRRAQDVPKMFQDAPRRTRDGPRPPRGRARTAPRRSQRRSKAPKTPPDPRKKETQKRSEAQSPPDLVFRAFLGGFWSVFRWIWEGFGYDFGSLEVDFSRILGASPKPQDFQNLLKPMLHQCQTSAASERAQRAKRAERAIQEASRWMHEAISSVRNDFLRLP